MRNQWKRNAVVATVLLFVCAAVYLNWRYAGNVTGDAAPAGTQTLSGSQTSGGGQDGGTETEDGKAGGGSTKVLGDAALVGGVPTALENSGDGGTASAGSYFDTARLRALSRDCCGRHPARRTWSRARWTRPTGPSRPWRDTRCWRGRLRTW